MGTFKCAFTLNVETILKTYYTIGECATGVIQSKGKKDKTNIL